MADLSGNPLEGLYPGPPQNGGLLSNPLATVAQINQLQQQQAQRAVGNAFQGAIDANGNFDPAAANLAIKNNPAAAYGAVGGIGSALALRQQNIANATGQLGLGVANNNAAAQILAQYAQKQNPTQDDLNATKAQLAAAGVNPATVAAWGVGTNPKKLQPIAANAANYTMGPAAAATPIATTPTAGGAPQVQPLGARVLGGPAPIATALSPGDSEVIAANKAEYAGDQTKASATLANVRPLQQVLPLIQQLSNSNFGPGSPELAKIKGALSTAGIIDPNTSDLQVRQEAGKYLLRYAKGAQDAGRSDQALSAALGSNPNLDLTQPANLSLIKNQIGMDRMDAALPLAFGSGDPSKYKSFKSNYYQSQDPRAFSFDIMTPDERASLQKSLGAPSTPSKPNPAYDKFVRSYQTAKGAGMFTPPGAQQ